MSTNRSPAHANVPPTSRRSAIRFLATLPAAIQAPEVLALSPKPPPPPTLRQVLAYAELIVVGTVEKLVFLGVDRAKLEDFDKEFDTTALGRMPIAHVWVGKTLYDPKKLVNKQMRVQVSKVPRQQRAGLVGSLLIFPLRAPMHSADGPVFSLRDEPIPYSELPQVLQEITTLPNT